MVSRYYTVLGSLPYLPYFDQAERLPLTRLRLEQRIGMLEQEETRQLYLAEELVSLRKAVMARRSHDVMTGRLRQAMKVIVQPVLRAYVEDKIDQQTVVAALRLRHAGWVPGQGGGSRWGMGRRVGHIAAHWEEPDFRLGAVYPWIPQAHALLEAEDARGLERLLMDVNWRVLGRLADREPMGFGGIVAFLFKWDILNAWLAHNAERATQRFRELMGEVKHGQ